MKTVLAALVVIAHLTYYDPSLCGHSPINCFDPDYWWSMAAGHDARDWYGESLACPREFKLGSLWALPAVRGDVATPARTWICLDRGGRVVSWVDRDGAIHVKLDLLLPYRIVSRVVSVTHLGPIPAELVRRASWIRDGCGAVAMRMMPEMEMC